MIPPAEATLEALTGTHRFVFRVLSRPRAASPSFYERNDLETEAILEGPMCRVALVRTAFQATELEDWEREIASITESGSAERRGGSLEPYLAWSFRETRRPGHYDCRFRLYTGDPENFEEHWIAFDTDVPKIEAFRTGLRAILEAWPVLPEAPPD